MFTMLALLAISASDLSGEWRGVAGAGAQSAERHRVADGIDAS
jgi:hypothetical protein